MGSDTSEDTIVAAKIRESGLIEERQRRHEENVTALRKALPSPESNLGYFVA